MGSDNVSCFASHNNILLIYQLNKEYNNLEIIKWVYTEACTGKNRLDVHYSYLNLILHKYVFNCNDIITERDVYSAISHQNSIAGTTTMLLDGSSLEGSVMEKNKKFKVKTGVRETHELEFTTNDTSKLYTI